MPLEAHAGGARLLHELGNLRDRRLRSLRELLVPTLTQDADDAAQLLQRSLRRRADDSGGARRPPRPIRRGRARRAALRADAAGFLLKDATPAVRAIELVAAGESMLSPSVARRLVALVAGDPDSAARHEGARERLSGLSPSASTRSRWPSAAGSPTPRSPPSST